ncbi:MAG: LysR substrate-binding domain-containing protein [Pseudomonadota bacterium]
MNLDSLKLALQVVRLGSFAAVARSMHVDPSSISRAIATIEEELGLRLFQRTTRQLTLTEAGAHYLARVEAVIDELDEARDTATAIQSGPRGTLRMTASVAFGEICLSPLVPAFRARYPEVRLELIFTDQNIDLVSEQVDLAIRLASMIEGDLVCAKLFDTRYRVCASPDYVARAQALKTPEDLRAHDALLFALPGYRDRWLFRDTDGQTRAVSVEGSIVTSNAVTLRHNMLNGLGPALLANWLIDDDVNNGRCIDLFPTYQVTATSFETAAWLVYPSRRFLPNKVRCMIEFLRTHLASRQVF